MKFILSVLFLFLLSSNLLSDEIVWDKINFGDEEVSYPKKIISLIRPDVEISESECVSLDNEIQKLEKTIDRCKKDVGGNSCKMLEFGIRVFAQDRGNLLNNIGPNIKKKWTLSIDQAANTFPFDLALDSIENEIHVTYDEQSFLKMFEKIIPIDDSDKVTVINRKILTQNKFTACDLQRNKIKLQTNFPRMIEHTQYVPPTVLNFTWETYQSIRKIKGQLNQEQEPYLVQAALIGYELGKTIETYSFKDKNITVRKFFGHFFDIESDELRLKQYVDKERLENLIYPPTKSKKEINISWSNM